MATPRFRIAGPSLVWRVDMITPRVSVLSDEPIRFAVFADSGGLPLDPTGYTVAIAVTQDDTTQPEPGDWKAAVWDVTVIGSCAAQVNCGATGLGLALGTYYTWVKITNNAPAFSLVQQVGQVICE